MSTYKGNPYGTHTKGKNWDWTDFKIRMGTRCSENSERTSTVVLPFSSTFSGCLTRYIISRSTVLATAQRQEQRTIPGEQYNQISLTLNNVRGGGGGSI